jgi:hypothetical protein
VEEFYDDIDIIFVNCGEIGSDIDNNGSSAPEAGE